MSQIPNTAIAVVGVEIGKNSFHIVGHDERGAIAAVHDNCRSWVNRGLAIQAPDALCPSLVRSSPRFCVAANAPMCQ
jgi:hypothetical protein